MGEFIRLTAATLLGALISFGTTLYFERRKERRTKDAESQERDRQLQQATRLIWQELVDTSAQLHTALENKQWWTFPPHDLPQSQWLSHQATLAYLLSSQHDWSHLAGAYSAISELNGLLQMGREGKETFNRYEKLKRWPFTDERIPDAWQGDLRRTDKLLRLAIGVLRPIVIGNEKPEEWHPPGDHL